MYKYVFVAIGWLLTLPSYANDYYYDNLYQECDDLNKEFTSRIIQQTKRYCTPPLPGKKKQNWPTCCLDPNDKKEFCDVPDFDTAPSLEEEVHIANTVYECYFKSQSDKEQNIPPICFLASAALGRNLWNNYLPSSHPNKTNNTIYRYYHCNDSDEAKEHVVLYDCTRPIQGNCFPSPYISKKGYPPCSSKEYIHRITRAFNEVANCFGFKTKKEKEMIFALLNHESRFLLNKIEDSGKESRTFRCFGQINNDFIETLNRYIATPDAHTDYKAIYKNAIDTNGCSFLKDSIVPSLDDLDANIRQVPTDDEKAECTQKCAGSNELEECKTKCEIESLPFRKVHKNNSSSMICKTSQDPYSCLFYTIYNIRVNMKTLEQYLKNHPTVNSMKIKKKDYKIFDNKNFYFEWAVAIWSHNGGSGIIKKDLPEFIKDIKYSINAHTKGCEKLCSDNNKTEAQKVKCIEDCESKKEYGKNIIKKIPLSGIEFINEFQKYSQKNKVSNQDQVKNIIDDIQKDLKAFAGGESLESAMKNLPQKSKDAQLRDGLRRADLNEFLEDVQSLCPTGI